MDLLQRLGIPYPIFLAPMAGVSTPELAAIVSNMGGLGSLGLGAQTPQKAQETIQRTKQLTDKPFQVNFFCHQPEEYDAEQAQQWIDFLRPHFAKFGEQPPENLQKIYQSFVETDDFLDVILQERPTAVSFHFGLPTAKQLQALKQADILTMVSVTQPSEAKLAEQAGIDVLIAQGIEAGGHRGLFNPAVDPAISTPELLSLLKKQTQLPIVCAGGIMDGSDMMTALHAGADAVQMGTAFVQCEESAAGAAYRQALFADNPIVAISDSLSGCPAGGLYNAWHYEIDVPTRPQHAGYPYTYDLAKQLHQIAAKNGVQDYGAFWAGRGVKRIRKMNATELMQSLIDEWQKNEG